MPNRYSRTILFIATVALSLFLAACGDDGPSSPDNDSDFNLSGDLIAFTSYRDGQQEIYLKILRLNNLFVVHSFYLEIYHKNKS